MFLLFQFEGVPLHLGAWEWLRFLSWHSLGLPYTCNYDLYVIVNAFIRPGIDMNTGLNNVLHPYPSQEQ